MNKNTKILAIIPARAGSKRIKNKNLHTLCGRPLLEWTILEAKRAHSLSRIIVSSDSEEILTLARRNNVEAIVRPPELCLDSSSSESALIHALKQLKEKEDYEPDLVMLLQCTSPLMLSEDIDNTVKLINENTDFAFTCSDSKRRYWRENLACINFQTSVLTEAGSVYVMKLKCIKNNSRFYGGRGEKYLIPTWRNYEIDEPEDFLLIEPLMRKKLKEQNLNLLPKKVHALVMDFDGVFTDNNAYVDKDGHELLKCSRGDGFGLKQLKEQGIKLLVISGEVSKASARRCEKLEIPIIRNAQNKLKVLKAWANNLEISLSEVVYVGNDVNDLECIKSVGCGIVPKDAHKDVLNHAKIILNNCGGKGAIREVCDLILNRKGNYERIS